MRSCVRQAILQYGRTNGQLGAMIARMLQIDEDIRVPAESIMVTSGGQEAMIIALRGLCAEPEDVVSAAGHRSLLADEKLLELSARDYGVLWTPMSFFYLDGGGSHAIGLSCSALATDQIDEGVRRLAALIAGVRS